MHKARSRVLPTNTLDELHQITVEDEFTELIRERGRSSKEGPTYQSPTITRLSEFEQREER